jgi:hypothetical protein
MDREPKVVPGKPDQEAAAVAVAENNRAGGDGASTPPPQSPGGNSNPNSAPIDLDREFAKRYPDFLLYEYWQLRTEIRERIEESRKWLTLAITACGAIFAAAPTVLGHDTTPHAIKPFYWLTAGGLLVACWYMIAASNETIACLSRYIRLNIELQFAKSSRNQYRGEVIREPLGWESQLFWQRGLGIEFFKMSDRSPAAMLQNMNAILAMQRSQRRFTNSVSWIFGGLGVVSIAASLLEWSRAWFQLDPSLHSKSLGDDIIALKTAVIASLSRSMTWQQAVLIVTLLCIGSVAMGLASAFRKFQKSCAFENYAGLAAMRETELTDFMTVVDQDGPPAQEFFEERMRRSRKEKKQRDANHDLWTAQKNSDPEGFFKRSHECEQGIANLNVTPADSSRAASPASRPSA